MLIHKRIFDLFLTIILLVVLAIPMLATFIAVRVSSEGKALYWSQRIGKNNKTFLMPKFRSMKIDTPATASHLINDIDLYLTPIGSFIRKYSLDEFPQLFSILKGDMSFVGPRPALFNQDDLINLRIKKGVDNLTPGLTGWAQINGRDELSIEEKVKFDEEYITLSSLRFDIKILIITLFKVIKREGISH